MPNAIFAAPILSENAARVIGAAARLEGVRLGVVTQDPIERLPEPLRGGVAQHWRVADVLDLEQLAGAVEAVAERLGGVDCLFAAYEQLQVPIALVRERLGVEGMSADAARNFRDKARMKELFDAAGLPCARHARVTSADDAWRFVEANGYPVVIKPLEGAGAKSTFRVDTAEQLADALRVAPPPLLIEEHIVGEEHSFEGVMVDGSLIWHSLTHYRPTPLEVLRNGWIQWCIHLPRETDASRYDDIRAAAARALEVLGMKTGLCHLEWFRRRDGSIAISEVAARPPGAQIMDLVSYAHDIDFDAAWVRLMILGTFEPTVPQWSAGIAFLRGQGQGLVNARVKALHRVEEAAAAVGSLVVAARLPSIGQPPSGSYEGEGFIIVRDRETAVVGRALETIINLIHVELG
ncbi:MAG TPA: ATP-grasp domain-containing protein [Thermoanaerobaculia bacterium]|nr:ATP-grasp domain-containing protein [Thermoanaerobaculia bacterium]